MSKIWQHNCPYFSSALIQWKCKIIKYLFTPYTKLHLISVPLQKSSVLEGIGHSHTRTQRVTFKKIGPPSPFLFEMRKNLHWEWLHLEKHTYLHMINKRPMGLSVFPFKITPVQKSSLKIHFYFFFVNPPSLPSDLLQSWFFCIRISKESLSNVFPWTPSPNNWKETSTSKTKSPTTSISTRGKNMFLIKHYRPPGWSCSTFFSKAISLTFMLPKSSSKISCIKLALLSSAFSKLLKVVLFKLRLPSVVATNTRKPRQNKAIVFRKDIIDGQNRKLFFSAVIDSQDIQNYCSVPPYCCAPCHNPDMAVTKLSGP